jgi:hypothetical protein
MIFNLQNIDASPPDLHHSDQHSIPTPTHDDSKIATTCFTPRFDDIHLP